MTYRERLERKAERRREWAAGRNRKAEALRRQGDPFRGDWAFATQPGHIPERARMIRRDDKAAEHYGAAQHHEARAEAIETALDRSIFEDDPDAVERLEARIAEREAERDRIKRYNASCRKAAKAGGTGDTSILTAEERASLLTLVRVCAYQVGPGGAFPAYHLSNLGANIRRDRERIEDAKRRRQRTEAAEESTEGVTISREGGWCVVTFAEKPPRETLDALRAAGYHWGRGSWHGPADALPSEVA